MNVKKTSRKYKCRKITNKGSGKISEEHTRRLWTCLAGGIKNQIVYLSIKKRFTNAVFHQKTLPSIAWIDSDHQPTICKGNTDKIKETQAMPRLQYNKLLVISICKYLYTVAVKKKHEKHEPLEEVRNSLKEVLVTAVK